MNNREIYILIGGCVLFILGIWWMWYFRSKQWKYIKESELEQKKIFNKCIDLVIEGNDKGAKDLYDKCLFDRNGRRAFLHGLFIGLDLDKNKDRLLDHKYKIEE